MRTRTLTGLAALLLLAMAAFASPPDSMRVCKTTVIVRTYANSATDSTLHLVKADTIVTWDTTYGVGCPSK